VETILIYRTGQLGDTVCAMPAIRAVREKLKPCKIVLLSDIHPETDYPKIHVILSEFGLIDDYIVYNPKEIWSPNKMYWLWKQLIRRKVQRVIYLQSRRRRASQKIRDFMFFKACGIKTINGLNLRDDANPERQVKQEVERLLDILRSEKLLFDGKFSPYIPVVEQVKTKIDTLWERLGLGMGKVVALSAGSKMPVKRWDLDNYTEVGRKLVENYGVKLLIFGGKEDAESASVLCKAWYPNGIDMSGKTSYAESAEMLRRCVMYLGNDSGAMHLAAAVGIPCVAIFSARDDVGVWHPYGKGHIVLRKEVECRGCMLTECAEHKMKCIRSITVDDVFAATERILASIGAERRVKTLA